MKSYLIKSEITSVLNKLKCWKEINLNVKK